MPRSATKTVMLPGKEQRQTGRRLDMSLPQRKRRRIGWPTMPCGWPRGEPGRPGRPGRQQRLQGRLLMGSKMKHLEPPTGSKGRPQQLLHEHPRQSWTKHHRPQQSARSSPQQSAWSSPQLPRQTEEAPPAAPAAPLQTGPATRSHAQMRRTPAPVPDARSISLFWGKN